MPRTPVAASALTSEPPRNRPSMGEQPSGNGYNRTKAVTRRWGLEDEVIHERAYADPGGQHR